MLIKNNKAITIVMKGSKVIQIIKKGLITVYEAFKNLIVSGIPPLMLSKSKGVDLIDYKMYGDSVQEGENLFNPSMTLTNGVYLTNTGAETTNSSWNITDYIEVNGYNFTLTNVGGQAPSICAYDENKNFITGVKYGTTSAEIKTSVTISSTTLIKYIRISVYRVWINDGSVNDIKLLYSPTPDTPVEVESVGDKSKNIIPLYGNYTDSYRELTLTIENDVITINGTIDRNTQWGIYQENGKLNAIQGVVGIERNTSNLMTLKAGTYTITIKYLSGNFENTDSGGGLYYGLYTYKNGGSVLDRRVAMKMYDVVDKVTLTKDTEVQFFCLQFTGTSHPKTFNNYKIRVQLNEGSEATDYEPYGKYKIPVKVSGKNLLNKDTAEEGYFIHASGEKRATNSYGLKVTEKIPINPSKNYFYSGMGNITATTVTRAGYQYDKNGNPIKALSGSDGRGIYITPEPNCAYVLLQYVKDEEQPMLYEYYLGVTEDYEPYVEPITTDIYLDEPLRKVGDYADYIDFKNSKVVRNIKEYVFEGTEGIGATNTNNTEKKRISIIIPDGIGNIASNLYSAISNCYPLSTADMTYTCKPSIALSRTATNVFIYDEAHQTADDFKAFLQEQYNNGTPVIAYYPRVLLEETIELPNIPTIKGACVLEVDTTIKPSNVEVIYKGKE